MTITESNTIIAEYAGLVQYAPTFNGVPVSLGWYDPRTELPDSDRFNRGIVLHVRDLKFHEKTEWLYPVYIKLRKDLLEVEQGNDIDFSTEEGETKIHQVISKREDIENALVQGDIAELHSEIVNGIQFINENKK